MEDSKTPAYSQPGYGYHQPNHNINGKDLFLPKTFTVSPIIILKKLKKVSRDEQVVSRRWKKIRHKVERFNEV